MRGIRTGLACVTLLACCGCVERTLTITTEPEGADVWLDGREMGPSPIEIPFTHYGTRELLVRKPGFRSVRRLERIRSPWYQKFLLDLVFETLWPWTIHDRREVHLELEPLDVDVDGLLERARQSVK